VWQAGPAADNPVMACDHSAFHSGRMRYLPESRELQMVIVCDRCEAERTRMGRIGYSPQPRLLAGSLAGLTGRALGLSEVQFARVRFAALVCAMGRDQMSPEIVKKQGPLTDEERVAVRRQPELGAALLGNSSGLNDIREWILCHRERPDGKGYPRGLVGAEIPYQARILAVIDAYLAMTGDGKDASGRDHEAACRELWQCAGTRFDAAIVRTFVKGLPARDPATVLAA